MIRLSRLKIREFVGKGTASEHDFGNRKLILPEGVYSFFC